MDNLAPLYKIAAINVNSITSLSRKLNLEMFLKQNNIDICLLSETKTYKSETIEITNYMTLINNRNENRPRGGGTAILIKKGINFSEVLHPTSLHNKVVEYTIANCY